MPQFKNEIGQTVEVSNEAARNGLNLLIKATPPGLMVLDEAELALRNAERRAAQDAASAKDHPVDASQEWRGELEELTRRLRGAMTETEAKAFADSEAAKHTGFVTKISDEIAYVKSLRAEPFIRLCTPLRMGRPPVSGDTCDACLFDRKIAALEIQLSRAKSDQQKSIRICGGFVAQARELDALRPRWKELSARAAKVDNARKTIRGIADGGLSPQPIAQGDGFRSRHIKWEGNTPHQK